MAGTGAGYATSPSVTGLNPTDAKAEGHPMHGAWVFDLLLLFVTAGITVLAFRQFETEREQNG
jgi:hypothetical protein